MKKAFIVLLLAIASNGWSLCATGALSEWSLDNTLTDGCGGNSFLQTGTVPFTSLQNCKVGTSFAAVTFNASQYLSVTGATLNTMKVATAISIDFCSYKIARSPNNYVFAANSAGTFKELVFIGDGVNDNVIIYANGVNRLTWADSTGLNVCREYSIRATSSYVKLYVGDNGATPVLVSGTAVSGLWAGTEDAIVIGTFLAASTSYSGTMSTIRLSDTILAVPAVYATPTPTPTPGPTPIPQSGLVPVTGLVLVR